MARSCQRRKQKRGGEGLTARIVHPETYAFTLPTMPSLAVVVVGLGAVEPDGVRVRDHDLERVVALSRRGNEAGREAVVQGLARVGEVGLHDRVILRAPCQLRFLHRECLAQAPAHSFGLNWNRTKVPAGSVRVVRRNCSWSVTPTWTVATRFPPTGLGSEGTVLVLAVFAAALNRSNVLLPSGLLRACQPLCATARRKEERGFPLDFSLLATERVGRQWRANLRVNGMDHAALAMVTVRLRAVGPDRLGCVD